MNKLALRQGGSGSTRVDQPAQATARVVVSSQHACNVITSGLSPKGHSSKQQNRSQAAAPDAPDSRCHLPTPPIPTMVACGLPLPVRECVCVGPKPHRSLCGRARVQNPTEPYTPRSRHTEMDPTHHRLTHPKQADHQAMLLTTTNAQHTKSA